MCHQDAIVHCHASQDWANQMPGADNSPMIFPCLYRLMKTEEVRLTFYLTLAEGSLTS